MSNGALLPIVFALFGSLAVFLYNPIATRIEIFGIGRSLKSGGFDNFHGEGLQLYDDTIAAEDLHLHEPSGLIYGVAEERANSRSEWFPAVANFKNPRDLGQAHFFTISPHDADATAHPLKMTNFRGPFISHGFDVYSPPEDSNLVYIVAINHLPDPSALLPPSDQPSDPPQPAARSQIEIFKHEVGSSTVQHLRSVRHPLIRTPNDIYALNEHDFFVSNDHLNREGLKRDLEDMGHDDFGAWSDVIHVFISPSDMSSPDPTAGLLATVSLENVQNPNGLGHGRTADEILLNRAAGGVMHTARADPITKKLNITDTVQLASTIDNPSYFHDPYAAETGRDASGFVICGLAQAIKFPHPEINPTVVWLVSQHSRPGDRSETLKIGEWDQKMLFMDDGKTMNTGSIGIIVAIKPERKGEKKAWLFVSGPMSKAVIRTKIDL